MRSPKQPVGPGAFVLDDWFTELPQERGRAFKKYANDFETAYLMFSISLDEVVGLHKAGRLRDCYEAVAIIPALCIRLAELIDKTLRGITQHCVKHRINPSVAPLNPADFRGPWSHRSAIAQSMQHSILLKRGLQFRYKIRKLRSIIERTTHDFCQIAETLSCEGVLADAPELWTRMSTAHFDLNTCKCETIVMLKCFLHVLPENRLQEFEESVSGSRTPAVVPVAAKAAAKAAAP